MSLKVWFHVTTNKRAYQYIFRRASTSFAYLVGSSWNKFSRLKPEIGRQLVAIERLIARRSFGFSLLLALSESSEMMADADCERQTGALGGPLT